MITVCAWCNPGVTGPNVTHGICEAYKEKQLALLKKETEAGGPMKLKDVAVAVDRAISDPEQPNTIVLSGFGREDQEFDIGKFRRSGLRYCDIGEFRFVQQNPRKNSRFADYVRNGGTILWIFHGSGYMHGPNGTPGVVDGHFVESVHNTI